MKKKQTFHREKKEKCLEMFDRRNKSETRHTTRLSTCQTSTMVNISEGIVCAATDTC
jgi:hypothetical protein